MIRLYLQSATVPDVKISFKDNGERKEVVKEAYASKKSGGTAPKTKIITEESQVADRFRKLAGLKS